MNVSPIAMFLAVSLALVIGCEAGSSKETVPHDASNKTPDAASTTLERPKPIVVAAPHDRIVDKTFDDLKFEMEKGGPFDRSMLTDSIVALADRRIRIRGYMLPTAQKRGIRQFVLVRDNQECCFGPGAALFDCILVTMKEGESAEFSIRPIAVEGVFDIHEFLGPDRYPLAIYQLEEGAVE